MSDELQPDKRQLIDQPALFDVEPEGDDQPAPFPTDIVPDGSHEAITLPPEGGDPVTYKSGTSLVDTPVSGEAPTYPPSGMYQPVPSPSHGGTPDYSGVPAAEMISAPTSQPTAQTPLPNPTPENVPPSQTPHTPVPPAPPKVSAARRVGNAFKEHPVLTGVASGTTAVIAALGIFYAATRGGNSDEARAVNRPPAAASTHNTGPNSQPLPTEANSLSPTSLPNLGEKASKVGNIDLTRPLLSPAGGIEFEWRGKPNHMPMMLKPGGPYNDTQVAASVLDQLANQISTNQAGGASNNPYLFSDSDALRQLIANDNSTFQQKSKTPYGDQLLIYDSAANPAVFTSAGFKDLNGHPVIQLSSGEIILQRATGGTWQDPSKRNPNSSAAVVVKPGDLWFSYSTSPAALSISVEQFHCPELNAAVTK